jgi:Glycogen recognition site of AMP-activated protein kinase
VPHATFVSFALRIAAQSHVTVFTRRAMFAGPRISAERLNDELRRIDVRADSASRVEIMGDFTNWAPIPLERAGDVWRLDRAIPPGPHRIAIRLDGGPWIVPVNLPRVDDEFGGTVGIITVP